MIPIDAADPFDEEVDTVIGQLEQEPRYSNALLLHESERWCLTLVSEPGEPDLSIEVLDLVGATVEPPESATYKATLAAFVASRRERIAEAPRDYGGGSSYANELDYFRSPSPRR